MLTLSNLLLGYQNSLPILPTISEEAGAGELIALIGSNGVGKSTLLRTVAGLQPALAGTIKILGKPINALPRGERARLLSFVPSEPVRVPNLTVRDFVAMSRFPHTGWNHPLKPHDWEMVSGATAWVGIGHLERREMVAISDGERQRAMIAFALAQDTRVILMDEPTAFLDLPNKFATVRLLSQLAAEHGKTIIYSTHDLQGALGQAHTLWMMLSTGLTTGMPEELALNGSLGKLMAGSNVSFNLETGTFRNSPIKAKRVAIQGKGVMLEWTRRLAERLGFPVASGEADGDITVVCQGDPTAGTWQILQNDVEVCRANSLGRLAQELSRY